MYWHDNIAGLANVLAACASAEVRDVVFSSSAAVYGMPDVDLVTEELAPQPINPYGATKYVGEWMLADAERAHGMRTVALRDRKSTRLNSSHGSISYAVIYLKKKKHR